MKKLLSQLKSLFSRKKPYSFADDTQKFLEKHKELMEDLAKDEDEEKLLMLSGVAETLDKLEQQPAVELNLDTGKIILPDNLSDEDKAAVESALAELQKSLQNFTSDQFQSLEDFLSKSSESLVVPFTKANDLPDAQLQVLEEIENCKDDTDHWSDSDFIEALFGFYNQGYDFPGIEVMANKVNEKLELSKSEQKQLRDWYMLASQELVYEV